MAIVTGDRYLESLVKFVEKQAGLLIEGSLVLKLNPAGLHYVHSRLEALQELERLLADAPVHYLRAYVSDLGDHRALEQLNRILYLLPSLKVVSVLPYPARDPMPLPLWRFRLLRVLELRGCDLSTSVAKGLLELRHTLEKIICHNSTDALRHAFASRIAEIKASPQWNRLSFVSCACNGLVLMDESLLLLPMVETLDLSRNKFAKIDYLWKCTKLKHLDLGFNHLRTVATFSEATYHIVKLVLRNNALATLHGLENLKSLEGLDLSYNVISNFSELETLTGLPCLHSLWLEGNPLCCACWYRAEVFAYFSHPHKVNLDERGITFIELWKRQIIIIASKLNRPASFGFYSPANDDNEGEGSINPKRKKPSRLACIESGEQGSFLSSDLEAEIAELMNRVELMKKEHSVFWLREFKEWMYEPPKDLLDYCKYCSSRVYPGKENHVKDSVSRNDLGEGSGDKNCSCILGSENSSAVTQSSLFNNRERSDPVQGKLDLNHHTVSRHCMTAIDDILDSHSSFGGSGSPSHYKEDMLHRHQSLVEEILELPVDSFSLTSSESYSSGSEDDFCESKTLIHEDLCSTIVEKGSDESIFDSHGNDSNPECLQMRSEILPAIVNEDKDASSSSQAIGEAKKQKSKRKPKHRVVSLSEESDILSNAKGFTKIYKGLENLRKNHGQENDQESDFSVKNHARNDEISASTSSGTYGIDDFIQDYFNKYIGMLEFMRSVSNVYVVDA